MPRIKLTIEYDGTNYCGWQKQDNQPTIQNCIENAFKNIFQKSVDLTVAGRTDAGVHAAGQVAHCDLDDLKDMDEYKLANALNAFLYDKQIAVLKTEFVDDAFHARFGATKKLYRYVILNRQAPLGLHRNAWHVRQNLDVVAMHNAAQKLLGKHDFTSYRDAECQAKNPVRCMDRLTLWRDGEFVYFEAEAQSFLHHQIRNFTGTFVQVGLGKEDVDYPKRILDAKNRSLAGATAPPQGLTLVRVDY